MTTGTLITVYRGHDIREASQHTTGISLGVNIYHAGEFIGYEKNVAMAKSRIDAEVSKNAKAERVSNDTQTQTKTTFPRRFENNPNDLI